MNDASATTGDFCAYAGTSLKGEATGVYAAGTGSTAKGNGDPYYLAAFPTGQAAPAWQRSNYAQQTGACADGTLGFAWHEVIVARRGSAVDWAIDGIKLATISNATFTASNVFVGYWDSYASLSDNTNLSFGLVDNVRVETSLAAPVIAAQPQSQTVVQGSNATFTVTATGAPTPGYQWRRNGMNLAGANASSLTVTNAQPANAGSYMVIVTNSAGSATSAVALLTLLVPPWIPVPPPSSVVATQGDNVTFCVSVAGTVPLSYQWRFNGVSLGGATGNCYTRNNVQTNDAGTYSVVVSNVAGRLTNSTVLTVVVASVEPAQPGRFEAIGRLPDGSVQLDMSGTAGTNYVLEWTSNWLAWSNLCTLWASNGLFQAVDPEATNLRQRFYRLRLAP